MVALLDALVLPVADAGAGHVNMLVLAASTVDTVGYDNDNDNNNNNDRDRDAMEPSEEKCLWLLVLSVPISTLPGEGQDSNKPAIRSGALISDRLCLNQPNDTDGGPNSGFPDSSNNDNATGGTGYIPTLHAPAGGSKSVNVMVSFSAFGPHSLAAASLHLFSVPVDVEHEAFSLCTASVGASAGVEVEVVEVGSACRRLCFDSTVSTHRVACAATVDGREGLTVLMKDGGLLAVLAVHDRGGGGGGSCALSDATPGKNRSKGNKGT